MERSVLRKFLTTSSQSRDDARAFSDTRKTNFSSSTCSILQTEVESANVPVGANSIVGVEHRFDVGPPLPVDLCDPQPCRIVERDRPEPLCIELVELGIRP